MNRIFRLSAALVGALSLVTGFTACNKDDDKIGKKGVECCSYTYSGKNEDDTEFSYTVVACADGTTTYTNNKTGEVDEDNWMESGYETKWEDMKSYLQSEYGAKCN